MNNKKVKFPQRVLASSGGESTVVTVANTKEIGQLYEFGYKVTALPKKKKG